MALRTRNLSSALTLLLALAAAACGDETGPADPMREGLRAGTLPLDSLVWIERGELVPVVAPVQTPGDAIAWVDHSRARAGLDARLSGMYSAHGTTVEVHGCSDVRMAPMVAGDWELLGAASESEQELLVQLAPRLLGWAASCDVATVAPTSVQIALVPGAPVGVAWWPVDSLLLVNPAVLHVLGTAEAAGRQVETREQAVIGHDGYDACIEELSAECETCLASSGADCEALFASGETCVELSQQPGGLERYCLWRTYETEPWRILCLSQAIAPHPLDYCYPVGTAVVSVATLPQAILNYGPGQVCTDALESCATAEAAAPQPFQPSWVARSAEVIYDVQECADRLGLYCRSCLDPEGPGCPALFPGSTGPTDCFDLQRPENGNRGEWMYCASMAVTRGNIACLNAAGTCVERFYWEGGITGYNQMLLAMARTLVHLEECTARFAICRDDGGAPFPDYSENGDAPPTFDPFGSSGGNGGEGGEKCGG